MDSRGAEVWVSLADTLRSTLVDKGVLCSEDLVKAYWAAPRHRFVDEIYEYSPENFSWSSAIRPPGDALDRDWLHRIYRDQVLVTRVDEAGTPISTNSVPSLIFRMLSLANVRPGQRILEIGTGSGQLTALLCELTGPGGRVLTVELDSNMSDAAMSRFGRLYPNAPVEFRHGDAASVDLMDERFDLVISTASCWPVPARWLASLDMGGRILVELRAGLGGAMLFGEVKERPVRQRTVVGDFLVDAGAFMPMRSVVGEESLEIPFGFGEYETARAPANGLAADVMQSMFSWYCQLELPDARLIRFATDPYTRPAAYLIADGAMDAVRLPDDNAGSDGQLVSYGDSASLLERLVAAWEGWRRFGRPGISSFSFTADGEHQYVELGQRERIWVIDRSHMGAT